jgi:AraC-like DNA-binding protein
VCFCRLSATDLNRPQRGRALHHRCVLIIALRTTVTVCIDDRAIPLHPGEGILVLPFQFHDYMNAEREELVWLFMTFELPDVSILEPLRFRPFTISPELRRLAHETVRSYLTPRQEDVTVLWFRLLLARIRMVQPIDREHAPTTGASNLVGQVNQLMQRASAPPSAKEIAGKIGISESHLRAKFRESCGVSLGRHLRRLRMEKACGLLRLTTNRISEVGELCGFSSVFSFSRTFRLTYGVSPRAYRRGGQERPPTPQSLR